MVVKLPDPLGALRVASGSLRHPRPWAGYGHPVAQRFSRVGFTLPQIHILIHALHRHALLVIELGFMLHLDASAPYGFDVEKSLPTRSWLGEKLRVLDRGLLTDLLAATVGDLKEEIPGLGETLVVDVKHIYAWVVENNPRVYVQGPYNVTHIPKGDPDCRPGIKKSRNQEQPDGSTKEKKEGLFGYGSGVAVSTDPVYGALSPTLFISRKKQEASKG